MIFLVLIYTRFDAVNSERYECNSRTLVLRQANLSGFQIACLMSVALSSNRHQQTGEVRAGLGGRRCWATLGIHCRQTDHLQCTILTRLYFGLLRYRPSLYARSNDLFHKKLKTRQDLLCLALCFR